MKHQNNSLQVIGDATLETVHEALNDAKAKLPTDDWLFVVSQTIQELQDVYFETLEEAETSEAVGAI